MRHAVLSDLSCLWVLQVLGFPEDPEGKKTLPWPVQVRAQHWPTLVKNSLRNRLTICRIDVWVLDALNINASSSEVLPPSQATLPLPLPQKVLGAKASAIGCQLGACLQHVSELHMLHSSTVSGAAKTQRAACCILPARATKSENCQCAGTTCRQWLHFCESEEIGAAPGHTSSSPSSKAEIWKAITFPGNQQRAVRRGAALSFLLEPGPAGAIPHSSLQ